MERESESDGLAAVGELTVVVRRDVSSLFDHQVAKSAGRREALMEVSAYVESRLAVAGPYDDTRPLRDLLVHLADMIRGT